MEKLLFLIGRDYLGAISFVIALVIGLIECWKCYRTLPAAAEQCSWQYLVVVLTSMVTGLTFVLWAAIYLILGTLLLFASLLIHLL